MDVLVEGSIPTTLNYGDLVCLSILNLFNTLIYYASIFATISFVLIKSTHTSALIRCNDTSGNIWVFLNIENGKRQNEDECNQRKREEKNLIYQKRLIELYT